MIESKSSTEQREKAIIVAVRCSIGRLTLMKEVRSLLSQKNQMVHNNWYCECEKFSRE